MVIKCTHPMRAHVLADHLRRHGLPAEVVNEMESVAGYGLEPAGVFVPDSCREQVEELLASPELELPEDPDFVYEDGVEPRKVGPLEIEGGGARLIKLLLFVVLAALLVGALALLGDALGWIPSKD